MCLSHVKAYRVAGDGGDIKPGWTLYLASLESTGAAHIAVALRQSLSMGLGDMAKTARKFVIILNTGTASSCARFGRRLQVFHPTVPLPCRMHQFCIAVVTVFKSAGIMPAIFCAVIIVPRRRAHKSQPPPVAQQEEH